jgi:hypothetical protein
MNDALMPGALILYFMNGSSVKIGNAESCAEALRTVVESAVDDMECIFRDEILGLGERYKIGAEMERGPNLYLG